mgnify:CR=1 FL=1|tara:strand:+ start:56 stop:445 length:390 start_codon:yes stop_codon:yes gene_type:complete
MNDLSQLFSDEDKWTPKASCPQPPVSDDKMQELFDYWKETFSKRSSTVFDEARKKKIAVAIRNYGMEKCKKAIKGCALSSWHTGNNPQNKKYNDISLIFRNSDKVEMFLELYETESQAQKELDKWINEE